MAKVAQIKVIEVEKQTVPELDGASALAVASLANHPGFQYLLAKLKFQRAALKDSLEKTRHKEMRDVEFLQSGANWCNWLQLELERAIGVMNAPKPRPVRPYEQDAFEQLRQNVELVGLRNHGVDNNPADVSPQGTR